MWIFTTAGYVSAVQTRHNPDRLAVRARDRYSLESLADTVELLGGVPRPEISVGAGTDYPYRVEVSREEFIAWWTHEVQNYLTYTNFKSAAKESLGEPWAKTLGEIWSDSHDFTDVEGERHSPYLYAMTGRGPRR